MVWRPVIHDRRPGENARPPFFQMIANARRRLILQQRIPQSAVAIPMNDPALLQVSAAGLYCPAGDFHIDPVMPVSYAVITHGHADHARPGHRHYLAGSACVPILKSRLGSSTAVQGVEYGETIERNGVRMSLHPSGHILGAAQVRIEHAGRIWVVTGDFKLQADPTCPPFEPLRCHGLVMESTFGLPIFRWPAPEQVLDQINRWWTHNRRAKKTSLLFAYSLGKAQRILPACPHRADLSAWRRGHGQPRLCTSRHHAACGCTGK
jgi:Cft2 family RNA processing exonuclease